MNTTLAIILTVVVTNWTHIGDFRDNQGRTFDLQEGQLFTNTLIDVKWSEYHTNAPDADGYRFLWEEFHTNRFVLKSVPGPILPERKAILITNIWVSNYYSTNIYWFYEGKKIDPSQIPLPAIRVEITNAWSDFDLLMWKIWTGQTNVWITNKGILTNVYMYQGLKKTHAIPAIKLEDE